MLVIDDLCSNFLEFDLNLLCDGQTGKYLEDLLPFIGMPKMAHFQ